MGKRYLIDTNSLVDAQTKKLPASGMAFMSQVTNDDFTISFISYIEYLGYKYATESMEEFIALADVIEVNKAIIDATIKVRKIHTIKLPDAIIAATAIVYKRILITRNIADFSNIKGLKVINPWKLQDTKFTME